MMVKNWKASACMLLLLALPFVVGPTSQGQNSKTSTEDKPSQEKLNALPEKTAQELEKYYKARGKIVLINTIIEGQVRYVVQGEKESWDLFLNLKEDELKFKFIQMAFEKRYYVYISFDKKTRHTDYVTLFNF